MAHRKAPPTTAISPACATIVFNRVGDLERCALRPGNVHSADGWRDVLEPVLARYRDKLRRRYFRGDAAFANPEVYELLEAEGYKYTIRLPANSVLQERIGWLLKRPVGRPPHEVRATTPISATGRDHGRSRAGWWRRSSGIPVNCIRVSGSIRFAAQA